MAKIQRFEDLPVWNNARELCRDIFALMQKPSMKIDFELKSQINRSSASVMDNIAEGFERNNNKEFKHFLYISKSSCGEVRSQLYRAFDREYLTKEEFEVLVQNTLNISGQIAGLINYINRSTISGTKHKTANKDISAEPDTAYNRPNDEVQTEYFLEIALNDNSKD